MGDVGAGVTSTCGKDPEPSLQHTGWEAAKLCLRFGGGQVCAEGLEQLPNVPEQGLSELSHGPRGRDVFMIRGYLWLCACFGSGPPLIVLDPANKL